MTTIKDRVNNLINKPNDMNDAVIHTFTIVQREFKMSREELLETPIPAYMEMIKTLSKERKEMNKPDKTQVKGLPVRF